MMKYSPLFNVLKAALWEKAIAEQYDTAALCTILREAEKQTVAALVFQALVAEGIKLPSEKVFKYLGVQQQVIHQNALLNRQVEVLSKLFNEHDIDYAVVKGQVAASYYLHPEYRQAGDVDFYCNEDNYQNAAQTILKKWGVVVENDDTEFHDAFEYNGVSFEMHHTLAHFYNQKKDNYWKKLLSDGSKYSVKINGCNVRTLHPTIHSLYIFLHLYHHLLELGVGLRQFCDWTMILHACKDEIDHEVIKQYLKVFGLEKAYKACGAILVKNLGLPTYEFTYELTEQDMRYADKILDVVFYRGNMGHYNKQAGFYGWKHKLESACIKLSHFIKFYPLAPSFMKDWSIGVIKTKLFQ